MRFGLAIMNDFPPGTVAADRVAQLRDQVRAAQDAGIHSVWVLQHYLGTKPTLQPIPLLGALSAAVPGITLGTNMFILPLRHPVAVAEEYSTLDHLTGGNVVAGFGMGYRDNEFKSFGVPMDERLQRYEESIELIRALWTGERVTYEGRHFAVKDQSISLPPLRPGGPPIWVGAGAHRTGALRAARLGDAWLIPPHVAPDRLRKVLAVHDAELDRLGKPRGERVVRRELLLDDDPALARAEGLAARAQLSAEYGKFNAPDTTEVYDHLKGGDAFTRVADESYLFTDPATAVARLQELQRAGITYVVLRMQWYGLSQERMLQTLERFRTDVLPHVA